MTNPVEIDIPVLRPPVKPYTPLTRRQALGVIFFLPGLGFFVGGLRALFGKQADPETHPIWTTGVIGVALTIPRPREALKKSPRIVFVLAKC